MYMKTVKMLREGPNYVEEKIRVRARHKAIFKVYTSEPTQDKLNRDKMADMIAAGAHGVSNSRL